MVNSRWKEIREEGITYMTKADVQKQVNPTKKWTKNDGQKFSLSKKIFSEVSVAKPESSKTVDPDGKHSWNEKDEESCANHQIKH